MSPFSLFPPREMEGKSSCAKLKKGFNTDDTKPEVYRHHCYSTFVREMLTAK